MFILPKLIHNSQGFPCVLACLQAEPIGDLRKDLLWQVIRAHKTDRYSIFMLAVSIAVVKL